MRQFARTRVCLQTDYTRGGGEAGLGGRAGVDWVIWLINGGFIDCKSAFFSPAGAGVFYCGLECVISACVHLIWRLEPLVKFYWFVKGTARGELKW